MIDEFLPAEPLKVEVKSIDDEEHPEYFVHSHRHGHFHFNSKGAYKLCIENGVSQDGDGETRTIGFSVRVKMANKPHEDAAGPLTEQMNSLDDLADDLLYGLEELLDHLEMMTERERAHRDITEKTFR